MGWRGALQVLSAIVAFLGSMAGACLFPKKIENPLPKGASMAVLPQEIDTRKLTITGHTEFRNWCFAVCMVTICFFMPFSHLATHASDLGLGPEVYAQAYQAFGLCGIFGRLLAGYVATKTKPINCFISGTFSLGLCLWGLALTTEGWHIVLVMCMYGIASGPMIALFMPVLVDLFGLHRLGQALAKAMFVNGFSTFCGPIIAGVVADALGYRAAFCTGGVFGATGAMLVWYVKVTHEKTVRNAKKAKEDSMQGMQKNEKAATKEDEKASTEEDEKNATKVEEIIGEDRAKQDSNGLCSGKQPEPEPSEFQLSDQALNADDLMDHTQVTVEISEQKEEVPHLPTIHDMNRHSEVQHVQELKESQPTMLRSCVRTILPGCCSNLRSGDAETVVSIH